MSLVIFHKATHESLCDKKDIHIHDNHTCYKQSYLKGLSIKLKPW